MKCSPKYLGKKTPAKIRKIGNAMVATFTLLSGYAFLITEDKRLAVALFVIGGAGKFIAECFKEE
jgi:hypothetical protein